nr:MAG TPA: hypothetical protein [Caudoviricetes sp.]
MELSLASVPLTAHNARTTNLLKEITQHSPASIAGSFHR